MMVVRHDSRLMPILSPSQTTYGSSKAMKVFHWSSDHSGRCVLDLLLTATSHLIPTPALPNVSGRTLSVQVTLAYSNI